MIILAINKNVSHIPIFDKCCESRKVSWKKFPVYSKSVFCLVVNDEIPELNGIELAEKTLEQMRPTVRT
jgi:hypothetical protein